MGANGWDLFKSGWNNFLGNAADPLGTDAALRAAEEQRLAQQEARDFARTEVGGMRDYLAGQQGQSSEALNVGYGQGVGALGQMYAEQQGLYGTGAGALSGGYGQARKDLSGSGPSTLQSLMSRGDALGQQLSAPVDLESDPGYQYRLQQSEQAIGRAASAQGGRMSGRTLQALQQNAQGLASQEYQNAFNRQQQQGQSQLALLGQQYGAASTIDQANMGRQSQLAQLSASQGQGLAGLYGQQAGAAGQYGGQLAQMYQGRGTALAQNAMSTGDQNVALTNALIGAENSYAQTGGMGQQAVANSRAQTSGAVGGIISAFSDERLKDDIEPGDAAAAELLRAIEPYTYRYKNADHGDGVFLGVMAQDLEKSSLGREMVEDTPEGKRIDPWKAVSALLGVVAYLGREIERIKAGGA